MPATLKAHRFTLVLTATGDLTEAIANAFYEAGCGDGGVGSCDGVLSVDFDRAADSLGDAIGSAVKDVERAGFAVDRIIVVCDPVRTERAKEPPTFADRPVE